MLKGEWEQMRPPLPRQPQRGRHMVGIRHQNRGSRSSCKNASSQQALMTGRLDRSVLDQFLPRLKKTEGYGLQAAPLWPSKARHRWLFTAKCLRSNRKPSDFERKLLDRGCRVQTVTPPVSVTVCQAFTHREAAHGLDRAEFGALG
jgi:hypothetical protein